MDVKERPTTHLDKTFSARRRRFQFTLLALLAATLLISLPTAWLARKLDQERLRKRTVARIETLGGRVQVWRSPDIERVVFDNSTVKDADLAMLENIPELRLLDLGGTPLTDASVVHLAGLSGLTSLDLSGTRISGRGLSRLTGLNTLDTLTLDERQLAGANLT